MSEDVKRNHIGYCPKCLGTRIELQVWGRTEFYVCKDCITEVPLRADNTSEQVYIWGGSSLPMGIDGVWFHPMTTDEENK